MQQRSEKVAIEFVNQMQPNQSEDIINSLLQRIEQLELNERALQAELNSVRETVVTTERLLTETAIEASTVSPVPTFTRHPTPKQQRTHPLDRDDTPLHIGDYVFILTKGVHIFGILMTRRLT